MRFVAMNDHIPKLLGLLFILLTFGYSAFEKVIDFKGQTQWLTTHFAQRFSPKLLQILLVILIILDVVSAAFSVVGIILLWCCQNLYYGWWAAVLASITILCLLLGQRVAKDFQGAANLTLYFGVILIILYLFSS